MKSGGYVEYFSQPKFIVGKKAMEHIPVELDSFNAHRPLVLTSANISGRCRIKTFVKALYESNVVIGALFDDLPPGDSGIELVERLSGLYRWRQCDSIIAIGGGAVMDTARALNVAVSTGFDFRQGVDGLKLESRLAPLFYVASPVYDGFEASHTARIEGRPFFSEFLYPDLVCIDRRMAAPGKYIDSFVFSAVESLSRCVEGASGENDNHFLDSSAYAAIQLISCNLVRSSRKPRDKNAAVAVANGIAVAGSVRSNSGEGVVAILSQILSKETGYPPGMISGVLLPHALDYRKRKKMYFRDDLLIALSGIEHFCTVPRKDRAGEGIGVLETMISSLSAFIPSSLEDMRIQDHIIRKAADRAAEMGGKEITRDMCADILRSARKGKQGGSL